MRVNESTFLHPRHAELVTDLQDYLASVGGSERWLGLTVAKDARLMPNLKRGVSPSPTVLCALYERLVAHNQTQVVRLGVQLAVERAVKAHSHQELLAA